MSGSVVSAVRRPVLRRLFLAVLVLGVLQLALQLAGESEPEDWLEAGCAGLLIALGVAGLRLLGLDQRRASPLVTDRGRSVAGANPARPMETDAPSAPSDETRRQDDERGRTVVRRAARRCNCIGFVFGQENWEIDTAEVPRLLEDNCTRVPDGRVQVCNVVVWRLPDGSYDHAALVVEVTPDGRARTVRGKAATSNFVYDHAPEAEPYGSNYEVYERTSTDALDAATRDELRRLREAYDRIADKSSPEARDAAERLCRKKNGLRGSAGAEPN